MTNIIVKIVSFLVPAAFATLLLIFLATVHTALGSVHSVIAALAVFVVAGWFWTTIDHHGNEGP